ncbi:MAG: hypothetical protein ACRDBH_03830, partial [Bosea sp. (in: a-proteobacteria)]
EGSWDTIVGGEGNDYIDGGSSGDDIYAGNGAWNYMVGGTGLDEYYLGTFSTDFVSISLSHMFETGNEYVYNFGDDDFGQVADYIIMPWAAYSTLEMYLGSSSRVTMTFSLQGSLFCVLVDGTTVETILDQIIWV